ncbi:hypothetical protein [Neobacillus niacini]|uniref:hypothetical protein n=1 Tax=Neobacillus niacini TaxID=86668 RepID=UPI00285D3E62|nr:hypothetical protein [Neobacillus niacini]MDR6997714.1 curved DNA-binding protein CbpA [Neobacillus niacini]
MNTDQAYALLMDAGVTEENGIQTIRRWLRERKIYYEGNRQQKNEYILDNADQAFIMLKDAGVSESLMAQIVGRWLSEGKIRNVGNGNRTRTAQAEPNKSVINPFLNNQQDQMKIIHQLKEKIKSQDEHIKGMEQLHKTSIHSLIQQRDKYKKENAILQNEKSELQGEIKNLLKENRELRSKLLKLKEEGSFGANKNPDKILGKPQPKTNHYHQKLGLSRTASHKDILAGYKKLLKITHPDHGGNEAAFHYIKTDYDQFRNRE